MPKSFKFRHVNELAGFFVLAVVALVVVGALLCARSQRWFSRTYAFDVLLPEKGSFGVGRGSEIFILGVSAGSVYGIDVGDDGRIRAHVKVRSDFQRFVRTDSVATINKVFGVAGDSYMEITRGTRAPLPAHGATIPCESSEELPAMMEATLTELRAEVIPVVKKAGTTWDTWTGLASDLRQTQGQLNQLVTRLDGLAAGLEEGKGTAGKLLTDPALMDDTANLLARANAALGQLQGTITNIDVVVQDLHTSAAPLPQVTGALAAEAKDLPGLVQQTQQSMRELERLIEGLQRTWLVRKYINKTNPPPARPILLPQNSPK
jgi:phospholipid/cholesterol/gamma-HCH transport system substrate-binding protein